MHPTKLQFINQIYRAYELAVEKRYGTGYSKYLESSELENPTNTDSSELLPKQDLTI